EESVNGLEMVRQAVVRAAEIEPLVLDACPEIPIAFNEEAMGITKVIVERIPVAELAVVVEEATASGVVQFVIKKVARILFRRDGGRLCCLELLCACDDGRCDTDNQADKEQSYIFHRLRCEQRCIG